MYTTRPLFGFRPVGDYRQFIKGRLKHWRKLCNLSQVQAAKAAGVARSTWQTWEDPARDALLRLTDAGVTVYRTDLQGNIYITVN